MSATETTALVPAEVDAKAAEVEAQVAQAKAQAEAIQVVDQASADNAAELLREIKRRGSAAEKERVELTKPLLDTKKRIDQKFKDAMAPFAAADEIVRGKLGAYTAEQARIRAAEEARLERERQERERAAREARERQEAEERRKREQADADRREAEQIAREARDEEERAQAEELAEEARIKAEEAAVAEQAIASLPDVQLPKAVVESAPKQEGIGTTKRWDFEVTDIRQVPDFLPDGTPLKQVLSGALRSYMHEVLRETDQPPVMAGVKFKRKSGLSVRGSS